MAISPRHFRTRTNNQNEGDSEGQRDGEDWEGEEERDTQKFINILIVYWGYQAMVYGTKMLPLCFCCAYMAAVE